MADSAAQDKVAKDRIITHMNGDHHDSVVRYLEHLKGVSSSTARNAKIIDLSLSELVISNGSTTWRVPFNPVLGSWRDARERLVKMDGDALKALNRSDITVKEFLPPTGVHAVMFLLCLVGYTTGTSRELVTPGNLWHDTVVAYTMPHIAPYLKEYWPYPLLAMIAIHGTEAAIMARRLAKHSVPTFSKVWWGWTVSNFIEGFTAHQRLSKLVAGKKAEKEKRNH